MPVRPTVRSAAAATAMLACLGPALSGCGEVREALGQGKRPPDEFAVTARAPLSVPPEFGVRPPRPGAERPQEPPVRAGARGLVVGGAAAAPAAGAGAPEGAGTGDAAMRRLLALDEAQPGIRETVDRETALFSYEKEYLLDGLLFWKEEPAPGALLDAGAERRRLEDNARSGKPATEGESPVIRRKSGGLFDGLF